MFLFFFAKWICDWFNSEKSGFFVDPSVANFELRINSVEIFFFVIKTMLLKQTGCWAKAVEMNFMDLYPLKSSILTLHWHGFNTKCHKIVIIIRYGERQWMMNIFNRHLIMRIFSCTHLFDLFFHGIMQWECNLCLNWIGRFIDVAHNFFSFYSEFWKMFWKAVWPLSQFAASNGWSETVSWCPEIGRDKLHTLEPLTLCSHRVKRPVQDMSVFDKCIPHLIRVSQSNGNLRENYTCAFSEIKIDSKLLMINA